MEMTVCLDTSAYIAMFRGRKAVARFLAECETIVVPAAVVAFAIVSYDHHFDAFSMIQRIAP